jgi:hypothetical protein
MDNKLVGGGTSLIVCLIYDAGIRVCERVD